MTDQLNALRRYYESGITRSASFRKEALRKLKDSILRYEKELYDALYADLKKSPEESWVTELGIVINGIKSALRNLDRLDES